MKFQEIKDILINKLENGEVVEDISIRNLNFTDKYLTKYDVMAFSKKEDIRKTIDKIATNYAEYNIKKVTGFFYRIFKKRILKARYENDHRNALRVLSISNKVNTFDYNNESYAVLYGLRDGMGNRMGIMESIENKF